MKALVVVNDPRSEWSFLGPDRTPALLPLMDRPVLQHVIESLVSAGYREFEVASTTAIESIRELVGTGQRWGARIEVSALRSLDHLQVVAARFANGDSLLIVDAERIPTLPESPSPLGNAVDAFRGWGCHETTLDVSHPRAYMSAWRRIVRESLPNLVQTGRMKDNSVVIGRNTQVHPSATIKGPSYIGERSLIESGCAIGANAFVGADCIVSNETSLEDCVILPHSFVGTKLEVRGKIVYRSTVYDVDRDVAIFATEDFLLGATSRESNKPGVLERLGALALGTLLLPATVVGWLMSPFARRAGAGLGYTSITRDLCIRVAPGLWSVVAGKQHIVGIPMLDSSTCREVDALAPGLLSSAAPGLLTDAYIKFGPTPSLDQIWASIAFSTADRSRKTQRALMREYFASAFGFTRPTWSRARNDS